MEVIRTPPRQGKTTQLVNQLINDKKCVLFVPNMAAKHHIISEHRIQDRRIQNRILSFAHDNLNYMTETLRGLKDTKILVDDVDYLLAELFRQEVHTIACTEGRLDERRLPERQPARVLKV